MGKRELLIALAFAALGVVAWRLTAPPPAAPARRFSLNNLTQLWSGPPRPRPAGRAVVTTTGALAVPPGITDLRLSDTSTVVIEGTSGADVAWTLEAEASGPTEENARRLAERTLLKHDALGAVLALSLDTPDNTPRRSTLTLRVPAALVVRVESARRTTITSVAGVRLENLVGDTTIRKVTGAIDGGHRNGELTIEDAQDVTLTLVGSTAVIRRPRGRVAIDARNGSTRVEAPAGSVVAEVNGQRLTIADPAGPVRVGGIGGEVAIERPRATTDIDARRTKVSLTLDQPVGVTIFATEGDVTLRLADPSRIAIDAVADSNRIDASAVGFTPIERDGRAVLSRAVDNAPPIALRVERGDVVITPAK